MQISVSPQQKSDLHLPPPNSSRISADREFSELAILEARQSFAEDHRPHPVVRAVAVKGGKVLGKAHRGEVPGCHAEYILLERKLADASLVGATIYTTLEPCTQRTHPKVPCANRLVERKVKRIVIGMLDPNPAIRGSGFLVLREANIITEFFPDDLMAKVEDLNRDFKRAHKTSTTGVSQQQDSQAVIVSVFGFHCAHYGVTLLKPKNGRAISDRWRRLTSAAGLRS